MQGIILAAGYAQRMGELCRHTPKPLLPIAGDKRIIDYLVESMAELPSLTAIHVVTNARFEKNFQEWREAHPKRDIIHIYNDGTDSAENRIGAIGDLRFVINAAGIDDDVVVAAGDNFFTFPLKPLYDEFVRRERPAMVTALAPENRNDLLGWAVIRTDEDNRVLWLKEKPEQLPPDAKVGCIAVYFYPKQLRGWLDDFFTGDNNPDAPGYLPQWLYSREPVYANIVDGPFFDVGTPQAYTSVKAMLSDN